MQRGMEVSWNHLADGFEHQKLEQELEILDQFDRLSFEAFNTFAFTCKKHVSHNK